MTKTISGAHVPPISADKALRIVSRALAKNARGLPLTCHDTKPSSCRIYSTQTEPCWYIYVPWSDHDDVMEIRSRRVILIGKKTGIIHYDGSAGDEG